MILHLPSSELVLKIALENSAQEKSDLGHSLAGHTPGDGLGQKTLLHAHGLRHQAHVRRQLLPHAVEVIPVQVARDLLTVDWGHLSNTQSNTQSRSFDVSPGRLRSPDCRLGHLSNAQSPSFNVSPGRLRSPDCRLCHLSNSHSHLMSVQVT